MPTGSRSSWSSTPRRAPRAGLIESLALIKSALDRTGVRWIEQDGCEADDVIATLATGARAEGRAVDIMTPTRTSSSSWPTPACAC
ncbi:hypothetical protein [Kitasatospora sp. NPDC087315]|uniref:hypothetical protein n=1 Tax=Kitasatospora sp. NPDC087315 TaxID=3364069 RepID=UPI0037F5B166